MPHESLPIFRSERIKSDADTLTRITKRLGEKFPSSRMLLVGMLALTPAIFSGSASAQENLTPVYTYTADQHIFKNELPGGQKTLKQALEDSKNPTFARMVQDVEADITQWEPPALPGVTSILYESEQKAESIDDSFEERRSQLAHSLPLSAAGVLLATDSIAWMARAPNPHTSEANEVRALKLVLRLGSAAPERGLSLLGEPFQTVATGSTQEDALANALKAAAIRLGEDYHSGLSSTSHYDQDINSSMQTAETKSRHLLLSYRTLRAEEPKDREGKTFWKVTVEFIPAVEAPEKKERPQ